jgi:hypothetical protein
MIWVYFHLSKRFSKAYYHHSQEHDVQNQFFQLGQSGQARQNYYMIMKGLLCDSGRTAM